MSSNSTDSPDSLAQEFIAQLPAWYALISHYEKLLTFHQFCRQLLCCFCSRSCLSDSLEYNYEILNSSSALQLRLNIPFGTAKHMARENEYNEDIIHYEPLFQPRILLFPDPTLFFSSSYRCSMYFLIFL